MRRSPFASVGLHLPHSGSGGPQSNWRSKATKAKHA
jgi:hypothetical protein